MEFWAVWFLGWILVFITAAKIRKDHNPDNLVNYSLIIACIIIVGGIICAKFYAMVITWCINPPEEAVSTTTSDPGLALTILFTVITIVLTIFVVILPLYLTFLAGGAILGLYELENDKIQIAFIAIFIISVIGWTIPMCYYNMNIETATVVESTEEDRQLLSFCNIPVQSVSGEISGSSTIFSGSVSGSISTADNLPYWYVGKENKGEYDSAEAKSSYLNFIGDDENPHVKVIYYVEKEVTTNHNNGHVKSEETASWIEYEFYVPESVAIFFR